MCRSIPSHCLHNGFFYAILHILRLHVYDPDNCTKRWCGKTHDCWGDHPFSCVKNNNKMAHNFIRDGWALGLQQVTATTGYILPTSKIETEKPHLVACDKGAIPFDLSFDIDPNPSPRAPIPCMYTTIGSNVMITPPVPPSDFTTSDDVIESVTATSESHLQTREQEKVMRDGKKDATTGEYIADKCIMCDLVQTKVVLIPMLIDPHGNWGPLTQNLLCHHTPWMELSFPVSRPYAATMYHRASSHPCPSGVIPTASVN